MQNKILRKGLVVGIIILFIELAFIPSFNALSISKDIEITNPVIEDIKEDCNCNVVNIPYLLILSKGNLEISGKSVVLSKKIFYISYGMLY
jgi:hypothetical protein